jgi:hypothetical protein
MPICPGRIRNDVIAAHQLTESFPRFWREVILSYLSDDPVSFMAPGMRRSGCGEREAQDADHRRPYRSYRAF